MKEMTDYAKLTKGELLHIIEGHKNLFEAQRNELNDLRDTIHFNDGVIRQQRETIVELETKMQLALNQYDDDKIEWCDEKDWFKKVITALIEKG